MISYDALFDITHAARCDKPHSIVCLPTQLVSHPETYFTLCFGFMILCSLPLRNMGILHDLSLPLLFIDILHTSFSKIFPCFATSISDSVSQSEIPMSRSEFQSITATTVGQSLVSPSISRHTHTTVTRKSNGCYTPCRRFPRRMTSVRSFSFIQTIASNGITTILIFKPALQSAA